MIQIILKINGVPKKNVISYGKNYGGPGKIENFYGVINKVIT